MIAYNPFWLKNLFIRKEAHEAFCQNCLDKDELELINNKYPDHFYSPNFFIRIGLFILTTIIVLFTFGLFALLMLDSIEHTIGAMSVFFGLFAYAALEYVVQAKKHYQSGVDDALLWISAGAFFGGISTLTNLGELGICLIVFFISLYGTLRFADRLMSIVFFVALMGIFFFAVIKTGPIARAIVPFVMMALSVTIYKVVRRMQQLKGSDIYSGCLIIISIAALLGFYFSGNYFVVRELSNMMFNMNLLDNESIPIGWFFWIFTVVVPCYYIFNGIKKRDIVFIRVGLLLVAVIIFTIRYYFSIEPIELVMTAGGILLIVGAYGLTRYLKVPKFGFTYQENDAGDTQGKVQLESIIQLQTFTGEQGPSEDAKFGGGSFGGGGGSGQY